MALRRLPGPDVSADDRVVAVLETLWLFGDTVPCETFVAMGTIGLRRKVSSLNALTP
jgi:hypothetical protein